MMTFIRQPPVKTTGHAIGDVNNQSEVNGFYFWIARISSSVIKSALLALIYLMAFHANAADSHCSDQEQIVFSCSLGKKIVSVCASAELTPSSGYLQYRFGAKSALELILPASRDSNQKKTILANTLMFAGGGGGYLRFMNGRYQYVVYTAIGRGWGTKEGVLVKKGAKQIANLKCQDIPTSQLGNDFFRRAGLTIDPEEFLLP
jgi:hypothetical protein